MFVCAHIFPCIAAYAEQSTGLGCYCEHVSWVKTGSGGREITVRGVGKRFLLIVKTEKFSE